MTTTRQTVTNQFLSTTMSKKILHRWVREARKFLSDDDQCSPFNLSLSKTDFNLILLYDFEISSLTSMK